jgi:hypothetical protein
MKKWNEVEIQMILDMDLLTAEDLSTIGELWPIQDISHESGDTLTLTVSVDLKDFMKLHSLLTVVFDLSEKASAIKVPTERLNFLEEVLDGTLEKVERLRSLIKDKKEEEDDRQ